MRMSDLLVDIEGAMFDTILGIGKLLQMVKARA